MLIAEGHNVVEVARQAGHSPKMALDTYAHVMDELDPVDRIDSTERIRAAREEQRQRARQPTLFDEWTEELPATYTAVHRYDGAVLQHDRRAEIVPMAIQPRDFAIVLDVWRYKSLTAPMVHELHWDGGSMWPAQRRLQKLFAAGLLERFRPISLRGSYPWAYHLGERGHAMLRDSCVVEIGYRHRPRVVHEFGYVLHELQLNAWVLAFRSHLGERLLAWEGERDIEPPRKAREEADDPLMRGPGDTTVHGLADERERRGRPDAVLELDRGQGEMPLTLLIEFDRTGRVDKKRATGTPSFGTQATPVSPA